jgi:hypothetical protein
MFELNPTSFRDLYTAAGLTETEFTQLVSKIKLGDKEAYQTLIKYMGGVNAGIMLRIPSLSLITKLRAMQN